MSALAPAAAAPTDARPPLWISFCIPLLFALLLAAASSRHVVFEEWDGVLQLFAGRELVAGQGYRGYASHFWPPLYPLLTGLLSSLLPGHDAAKLISHVAAVGLLWLAFWLEWDLVGSAVGAVMAQLFLVATPLFFRSALQAENHMLDSLLFIAGVLLLLESGSRPSTRLVLAAGVVCGLAGLTRYTSYVLLLAPLPAAWLLWEDRRWRATALFLFGFAAVSAPWWLYNLRLNGSPTFTWQYLNIGTRVVPSPSEQEWLWRGQEQFSGVRQIMAAYPAAYALNVAHNLMESVRLMLASLGVLALFVVPAAVEALLARAGEDARAAGFLMFLLVAYLALVSQAFVFEEVFLTWVVVGVIFSTGLLRWFGALARERLGWLAGGLLGIVAVVLILAVGARETAYDVVEYLEASRTDGGHLTDVRSATAALRRYDPDIGAKRVMSMHPAWAYYAGSGYVMLPGFYRGGLKDLVEYRGLTPRIRAFVPRHPATIPDAKLQADYLVYDTGAAHYLPQFRFLLDPAAPVPAGFRAVYRSPSAAVYAVERP